MRNDERDHRSRKIQVPVTRAEERHVKELAASVGVSVAAFVRQAVGLAETHLDEIQRVSIGARPKPNHGG